MTTAINISEIQARVIGKLVAKNGTTFVGISGYTNGLNVVSNHVVNANFSYGNAKKKDIETLKNANDLDIQNILEKVSNNPKMRKEYNSEEIKAVISDMAYRFENPNKKRSDAQNDLYTPIKGTTLRVNNKTGEISLYGLEIDKKIVDDSKKEEKKPVNSADKTMIQKSIAKYFDLRTSKFRNFNITEDKLCKIAITGDSFTFK